MKKYILAGGFLLASLYISGQEAVHFPDDFTPSLAGKEVVIQNPMYVTETYFSRPSGDITVSYEVLKIPTELVFPGSPEYFDLRRMNNEGKLTLKGTYSYVNAQHTLRIGSHTEYLRGYVAYDGSRYSLAPAEKPLFTGNERTTAPASVGNGNMKIVNLNLEYFMASPQNWGHSNGAKDKAAFGRQRAKILAALEAMDADVYALCEVEEGDVAIKNLTDGLNEVTASRKYKYVNDYDKVVTSYTKNIFIYNSERVTPYLSMNRYTGYLPKRHIAQCFELRSNGEKVIINLNHFKAKSGNGTGANADQGDGQGVYNATRVQEARDCLTFINSLVSYYGDNDILVVGDLNAYSMEDPVRIFLNAGYASALEEYSPDNYSYVYRGEAGYLDHSLYSATLASQITGAIAWNINADEPDYMGYAGTQYYSPTPYRCSDHNPIITGLALGGIEGIDEITEKEELVISGNPSDGYVVLQASCIDRVEVYAISGNLIYSEKNESAGPYFVLPVTIFGKGIFIVKAYRGKSVLTGKMVLSLP